NALVQVGRTGQLNCSTSVPLAHSVGHQECVAGRRMIVVPHGQDSDCADQRQSRQTIFQEMSPWPVFNKAINKIAKKWDGKSKTFVGTGCGKDQQPSSEAAHQQDSPAQQSRAQIDPNPGLAENNLPE